MAKEEMVSSEGFYNLANSIRRSTALYVAMQITPPNSSIEEMLVNADTLAVWLKGKAGQAEEARRAEKSNGALGIPFDQRDAD